MQGTATCQLIKMKGWVEFDLINPSGTLQGVLKIIGLTLICLSLVACQDKVEDSPEMEKLEEEQAALKVLIDELKNLRAEIAKIKVEKLEVPVEELQKQLDDKKAAILALEEELAVVTKSERKAEEKLEAYRKKYPLE